MEGPGRSACAYYNDAVTAARLVLATAAPVALRAGPAGGRQVDVGDAAVDATKPAGAAR